MEEIRECYIIGGVNAGKKIEDFDPPLTEREIQYYNSCIEGIEYFKKKGIDIMLEPIFDLDSIK